MLRITDVGRGGLSLDLPDRDIEPNMVNVAINVTAVGGMLSATTGFELASNLTSEIKHLQSVNDAREARVMVCLGDTKAYNWAGASLKDITDGDLVPLDPNDKWSSCELGGMVFFTHHKDHPRAYVPNQALIQYMPWNADSSWKDKEFTGSVIASYKNFLVMGHLDEAGEERPRRIRWSASVTDEYTIPYWEPKSTNDAGAVSLGDLSQGVIDMEQLGDSLVIYGADTAYLMQWVGGDQVMRVQRLPSIPGCIRKGMALQVNNVHFVVGQTDIYLHNGGEPTSIADERIRNTVFNGMTDTKRDAMFIVKNWQMQEVWLCLPHKDETIASYALVWSWVSNTWTSRELPGNAWCGTSGTSPACTDEDGFTKCYTWDTIPYKNWNSWPGTWAGANGNLSDMPELLISIQGRKLFQRKEGIGDTYLPMIERTGLQVGEYNETYTLLTAYPSIEKAPALIQVGVQTTEGGPVKWSKESSFTPGEDKKIDVRGDNLTGCLLAYRIYSTEPSLFDFTGLEVDVRSNGKDG